MIQDLCSKALEAGNDVVKEAVEKTMLLVNEEDE